MNMQEWLGKVNPNINLMPIRIHKQRLEVILGELKGKKST